jgi:hypothetical protein
MNVMTSALDGPGALDEEERGEMARLWLEEPAD